jgi:hypothetical protein
VARAGAALRSLHAGVDVLSCADLARLLGGGACPALEELTTATTTALPALDFHVPAGVAILAACPALRVLNCRVSHGDDEAEQDGPALSDGMILAMKRASHLHLCATVTEATAAGPVTAAFARAFARGAPFGGISHLELKILGPWSSRGALAWAQALEELRDNFSGRGSSLSGRVTGLRLLWDSAESCPLCSTLDGVCLIRAATDLCAECANWPQPFTVAVRCASCASCKLRLPLPSRSDHHKMDRSDDDSD